MCEPKSRIYLFQKNNGQDDGGTFTINDKDVVKVKDYLGKRYICLKFDRTGKDGNTYTTV
jgi:hypothetical protein